MISTKTVLDGNRLSYLCLIHWTSSLIWLQISAKIFIHSIWYISLILSAKSKVSSSSGTDWDHALTSFRQGYDQNVNVTGRYLDVVLQLSSLCIHKPNTNIQHVCTLSNSFRNNHELVIQVVVSPAKITPYQRYQKWYWNDNRFRGYMWNLSLRSCELYELQPSMLQQLVPQSHSQ